MRFNKLITNSPGMSAQVAVQCGSIACTVTECLLGGTAVRGTGLDMAPAPRGCWP